MEPWTAASVRTCPPRATGGESRVTTISTSAPLAGAEVPAPAAGRRRSASRERRATRRRLDMLEKETTAARIGQPADVAELVDAHGSGPCGGDPVEVQVLSSAPNLARRFEREVKARKFASRRWPMIYALVLGLWGKHDFPRREQRSTDEQGCRSHVDVSRRVRRRCKRWGRRGFRLVLLGRRRGLHSEDAIRHDVSGLRAEHLRGLMAEVGALVSGRRTFERAGGWGGQH